MPKYKKKPVVIEAVQFTGKNHMELYHWIGDAYDTRVACERFIGIKTLEGLMTANQGDWIIKGVKGEFYPCKPDIFAATYEPA